MTVSDYLLFFQTVVNLIPFTVLDFVFLICLIIFVLSEKHTEFLKSVIILLFSSFVWCLALVAYSPLSSIIQQFVGSSKGAADGIGLLVIVLTGGVLMAVIYRLLSLNVDKQVWGKQFPVINSFFGGLLFCIITSATTTILLSFPLTPFIKSIINESVIVSSLGRASQSAESTERKLFGMEVVSTVNFLTVEPSIDTKQPFIHGQQYTLDLESNAQILEEVNKIRLKAGAPAIVDHRDATMVSQALAQRMVTLNQLSRTEIDGSTPSDLLAEVRMQYAQSYFMTSHAQSVKGAIQGLSQIPSYNTQLTYSGYTSVGIGVVSLDEYGFIVTLLFIR